MSVPIGFCFYFKPVLYPRCSEAFDSFQAFKDSMTTGWSYMLIIWFGWNLSVFLIPFPRSHPPFHPFRSNQKNETFPPSYYHFCQQGYIVIANHSEKDLFLFTVNFCVIEILQCIRSLCLEVWFSSESCWRETFWIYFGSNLLVDLSEQTSEVLTARNKD